MSMMLSDLYLKNYTLKECSGFYKMHHDIQSHTIYIGQEPHSKTACCKLTYSWIATAN